MAEISSLYASALFDLFLESGAPDESFEQAVFLRDTLQDSEYLQIICHPRISVAEKCKFFREAFSESIRDDLLGLLFLAVEKNRENYIIPALAEFIDKINGYRRKTEAYVISATELSGEQVSALKELLSKKLDKDVEILLRVDPSVIGGLYIRTDGYLLDRTVKRQLRDMEDSMKKEYDE
ncbi:MAG: ATP synthase F1 subunit delta [Oscillospiraceae bacterium]|nr:ATP synthase F1 subunit delta [Oscillospiraceae bacterium]